MVPRFKSFYAKKNKLNYYAKYPIIQMKTKHNPYVYIFCSYKWRKSILPCIGGVGVLVDQRAFQS